VKKLPNHKACILGPREKLLGRAGFHMEIYFPKPENKFKSNFFKAAVGCFPAAIARGHEADPKSTFEVAKFCAGLEFDPLVGWACALT
jgi:hypothetical protein